MNKEFNKIINNILSFLLEIIDEMFWKESIYYKKIFDIKSKDNILNKENILYIFEVIKKIWENNFILYLIKNRKDFLIKNSKIFTLIPFFSIKDFLEKWFQNLVDEWNKNIDFYKQLNYNIIWIFISIFSIILSVNNWINDFTTFVLWFLIFLFITSILYFIKNYISIVKNNYRLEMIEFFIKSFENWLLNDKNIDFIIKLLEANKETKQENKNEKKLDEILEIFLNKSKMKLCFRMVKDKILFIIISIIYFSLYFCNFNYIKNFLIEHIK